MLPEAVLSSVIIALIRKGKFTNFEHVYIKGWYLILLSALVQVASAKLYLGKNEAIINILDNYYFYIHILSYILLLIGLILNIERKSFQLITVGTVLNFICILANNGTMPVHVPYGPNPKVDLWHSILDEGTRLITFADVIPIPKPYPFPKLLSIGDLLIIVGTFIFIQNCMVVKEKYSNKNFLLR
ncbi:DUF5317 family protein [Vallitalea okinawensis]|uniref:DUF5317 family protein n=1 Tax=Vallitalea okinawensis TaxID=2078660 RepID=UPI000CFDAD39|nr:DUF5317 family protein [Vallitalea okinawensis]